MEDFSDRIQIYNAINMSFKVFGNNIPSEKVLNRAEAKNLIPSATDWWSLPVVWRRPINSIQISYLTVSESHIQWVLGSNSWHCWPHSGADHWPVLLKSRENFYTSFLLCLETSEREWWLKTVDSPQRSICGAADSQTELMVGQHWVHSCCEVRRSLKLAKRCADCLYSWPQKQWGQRLWALAIYMWFEADLEEHWQWRRAEDQRSPYEPGHSRSWQI